MMCCSESSLRERQGAELGVLGSHLISLSVTLAQGHKACARLRGGS